MKFEKYSWFAGKAWLGILLLFLTGPARGESPLTPFLPRPKDFTLMWWANGPQKIHAITNPPPEPVLCFQSGTIGLAVETKKLLILHAGRFAKPQDMQRALGNGVDEVNKLPPIALQLAIRRGTQKFICTGRSEAVKDDFFFPVRFVESGHFFQHVAIEGLEFIDAAGVRFDRAARLEIALWPDRLILSLAVDQRAGAEEIMEISAGENRAIGSANAPAVLELFTAKNPQLPSVETEADLKISRDETLGCTTVKIPKQTWKNSKRTPYPEEELDRLDRWRFTLRNESDREIVVPLMFVDENPPAVTGFTPLLCDGDGAPTGIPVQISKNWHRRAEKGDLLYQGPWFHGCTFVRLPPRSKREFIFAIAYARYGGIPAVSHAQLSLIGWGHNQFWDEAAIGSFGESICYEPGRLQRRCFIDDIRPFMTLPHDDAKPYGWAGNGGGGDFLVWFDQAGRYQSFCETRTDYRAYGPCLTDVNYIERTIGGEIRSHVKASISRSDDYLRAWYHVRYEVQKTVSWNRLAFFQLGADYYNETPARRVAVGNANSLADEWEPARAKDTYDRRGVALAGDQPWISVHGVERAAMRQGGAIASRGLIVRSWKSVLQGKRSSQPYASFYSTEWGKGNFRTSVELSAPPEVTQLKPGDFVEADLELVMFPADAPAYYGANQPFRSALQKDADTWRLVQREAAGNILRVNGKIKTTTRKPPLSIEANRKDEATLDRSGGIGFLPVTFTGLSDYTGFELRVDGKPLNQSIHGNDFWQTDYDTVKKEWSRTYNIPRDGAGTTRLELRRVVPK